ncbi:TIGR00282 family metallophosphoesterase [Sulfurospirillum multivorans]|uniref:Metallophosphatase domain-containing protein n=2 Tax=Sulfurospirillum multivorans TaxID=66821 RepID=A0AA86DYQ0_SULMK|nr:TIGR00282 family metallophosphoesterase [Sulfurospirillum multivorans]AHJ13503.1 metallophosphatase domain-containing protein [Sulfurospirillum multivorans DSM 12446]QEH06993.1 metallophosphatase domain-containing protein [Sulfurospirillum multivorans]
MKIGFIGDIVGRPGRSMLEIHLRKLRQEFGLDLVIANGENASHGFGLCAQHAKELFSYGADILTGGNHSWDKKEIIPLLDVMPILRPLNYPQGVPGKGVSVLHVKEEKVAIINVMGHYGMPMVENPFLRAQKAVDELRAEGIESIIIDFHAEVTSEKRAMHMLLKGNVSAILGTHTHVGTDDLQIVDGTCYVTDVGLSGARDGVIGMDKAAPLKRFLTGLPASLEIPKKCKKILQMVIIEIEKGKCVEAFKLRVFDDQERIIARAVHE